MGCLTQNTGLFQGLSHSHLALMPSDSPCCWQPCLITIASDSLPGDLHPCPTSPSLGERFPGCCLPQEPGLLPPRLRERRPETSGQVPPALSVETRRCTSSGLQIKSCTSRWPRGRRCWLTLGKATLFCHQLHPS